MVLETNREINLLNLLSELSTASGVSGYEKETADLIEKHIRPYVDDIRRDANGNLVALKKGTPINCEVGSEINLPRLYIAAHMDEIGLMVMDIDEKGFIRFTTIGGFDPRILPGQPVKIHGTKGNGEDNSQKQTFHGVIGHLPPHLQTADDKKAISVEDLHIDTAMHPDQVRKYIRIGDIITMDIEPIKMQKGDYLSGKALDDRAGVAAMILCAAELNKMKHEGDIYFTATVQEEVGTRGAITSTYSVEPDLGIAIDVCHGDMPGVPAHETQEPGKGPAIAVGPNIHPVVARQLQETAKEIRIPFAIEPEAGPTGTDARAIQISRDGVPTGLLGIPLRYMHTTVELVNLKDIRLCASLLAGFAARVDEHMIREITEEFN